MFPVVPFGRLPTFTPPRPRSTPTPAPPSVVVGLDLGQAADFTAIAVVEKVPAAEVDPLFLVRHLERLPLGTGYPAVVEHVRAMFEAKELAGATLAVDQTGVGRPVVDLLRQAKGKWRKLLPVTITAGQAATRDGAGWRVPKIELVSAMQVALQDRRLKVAADLPFAAVLVEELKNFKVRITPAMNEQFGSWRDGQNDDLVLALGIAVWAAVQVRPGTLHDLSYRVR